MHGVKKHTKSEAEKALQQQKAQTYLQLVALCLKKNADQDYSQETLAFTGKLIKANPDFYTAWNLRRKVLLALYGSSLGLKEHLVDGDEKISAAAGEEVRDLELDISTEGIKKNSKSYGAWHHRKWIVARFAINRESELELCKQFLTLDQRNFHCWAYRRYVSVEALHPHTHASYVMETHPDVVQQEFDFSTLKVQENFSNYSALHHRSVYIQQLLSSSEQPDGDQKVRQLFDQERELIENAIFTEPDDQSAWWYVNFLVKLAERQAKARADGSLDGWLIETLHLFLATVNQLIEIEPECKWPHTCLINITTALKPYVDGDNSEAAGMSAAAAAGGGDAIRRYSGLELDELLEQSIQQLMEIDPMHGNRYFYLLTKM